MSFFKVLAVFVAAFAMVSASPIALSEDSGNSSGEANKSYQSCGNTGKGVVSCCNGGGAGGSGGGSLVVPLQCTPLLLPEGLLPLDGSANCAGPNTQVQCCSGNKQTGILNLNVQCNNIPLLQ